MQPGPTGTGLSFLLGFLLVLLQDLLRSLLVFDIFSSCLLTRVPSNFIKLTNGLSKPFLWALLCYVILLGRVSLCSPGRPQT